MCWIGRSSYLALIMSVLALALGSCSSDNRSGAGGGPGGAGNGPKLLSVNFDDPVAPASVTAPVALTAAKNETVSFAIRIDNLPKPTAKVAPVLRMQSLRLGAGKQAEDRIDARQYAAYQILPMPVDLNRAGFVRHTGMEPASDHPLPRALPRALLPLPVNDGKVNLNALRDPNNPRNPQSRAAVSGEPVMLWIDLTVPVQARPGDYQTTFEILQGGAVASTLVVNLHVNDFALPDDRHLQLVGRLEWASLKRLYPAIFETVRPELMSRKDPQVASALKVIDDLVKLGQQHRAQVVVPQLQPVVKWFPGAAPRVTWEDFDSVVMPWLTGEAFADRVPIGYWPLPAVQYLDRFDVNSQAQYYANAATHFDQRSLLRFSPIVVTTPVAGRVSVAESFKISAQVGRLLAAHPGVRVNCPLEDEQVQFASADNANLVDPKTVGRLVTAGAGLVFPAPTGSWPKELTKPPHWLRTDLPGLVPYVGAGGDERDVRLWAWLAFLRQGEMIQWPNTLPDHENPDQPADPNALIWFYPGEWFGVGEPVPTIQLKWLRRAQQDYEYLYLARQRGELIRSLVMARLITKPVEIPLTQIPDPTYALMCGTTDLAAWESVKGLLSESILLRAPGQQADENKGIDLNGRIVQWAEPQERPVLMGRTTTWGWGLDPQGNRAIDFRLGVDIYNAADQLLSGQLQWSAPPAAWQCRPQPLLIPLARAIPTYNVRRFEMDANVNQDRITAESRQPIDLIFTNELRPNRPVLLRIVAPVAIADRRGNQPLKIDGSLEDWSEADSIQSGPLVRMLNRPAVQKLELQYASTPTNLYSGWSEGDFYLAFKLNGVQPAGSGGEGNFVEYQFGRAWNEDLCEVLLQPVYADGSVGPILHMVCKPRGASFVERKVNPRQNVTPWEAVVGEAVRYWATTDPKDNTVWRGEIAIPWAAINDKEHQAVRPSLLRFNFVQHKNATGESASWAGPVDAGRDENFTGVLYLRDPANPGG